LHLREEFSLRCITEGVLKKDQMCIELLELLDEQPLMGIFAGESVWR
jgi:hypothetical protein